MVTKGGYIDDFDEDDVYDNAFPRGADQGFSPERGFSRWVRINDRTLFTEEALQDPVIQQFVSAPFSVNYAQFKSSTRESEYFVHKPHRTFSGEVEGIEGTVEGYPFGGRIATLVINHERTLARHVTRSIVIEDGAAAGQMIHKEAEPG